MIGGAALPGGYPARGPGLRRPRTLLNPQQDATRRLAGGGGDGAGVERNLTAIGVDALAELVIGLEVDDEPFAVVEEGEVDRTFHQRAVFSQQGQRRFASTSG